MANLVARNSTGFTTATTWGVGEAGSGATQTARSASTNTTTSYVYAAASFTVTLAANVEGLMLRAARLTSTGTVTVTLSADGGSTPGQEVTVNASDLPLTDDTWVFFKFGTAMVGLGTATYRVGIKGSSAGNAAFYRDATAANWTRILRTDATQVPVAADAMYIAGEWTAAATVTTLTVTLNETATTDYGLMEIGLNGVATAGTVAATAYNLKLSGDLNVWAGGNLTLGTSGTPVPAGSTFLLNLDSGSNVQYGLIVNNQATFVSQGATITVKALLAANVAAAGTTLTSDVSTGWLSGDSIALPSTTRTFSEGEKKAMSGNATTTSIPIAAVTNAHSGTTPALGELLNLTRNVRIFGASTSLQAYVQITATASFTAAYTEFYFLGSATALKRGISAAHTTGTVNIQYCSIHDFIVTGSVGVHVTAVTSGTTTIAHNVGFDVNTNHFLIEVTANTTWTLNDNAYCTTVASHVIYLNDIGGTITNNTAASSASVGIFFNEAAALGTVSGNTAHSCASVGGPYFSAMPSGNITVTSTTTWRNNNFGTSTTGQVEGGYTMTLNGVNAFGNVGHNIRLFGAAHNVFNNLVLSGDSTFATSAGIGFDLGGSFPDVVINNSTLGVASGIRVAHSTADLTVGAGYAANIVGSNNIFASTSVASLNASTSGFYLGVNKWGQVSGTNRTYTQSTGATLRLLSTDSVIFKTAAPSVRMAPASAAIKFPSSVKTAIVASGAALTFSVWVRKSSSGDAGGADYNGAQPRLMLKTNSGAGIGTGDTDVVLATMSAALGTWELLSGVTSAVSEDAVLAVYVDCSGTTGWINIDDWTVA